MIVGQDGAGVQCLGFLASIRAGVAGTLRVGIGFVGQLDRRTCARLQYFVRAAPHDGAVPRVSFFYGIVITMYFYDHQPPHFHAQYAEHNAAIAIDGNGCSWASLPGRALKLVTERASLHRAELEADWERAKSGGPRADRPVAVRWAHGVRSRHVGGRARSLPAPAWLQRRQPARRRSHRGAAWPGLRAVGRSGFFAQVRVDDELGTVVWPNGADLDPLVLHGDFEPAARLVHH